MNNKKVFGVILAILLLVIGIYVLVSKKEKSTEGNYITATTTTVQMATSSSVSKPAQAQTLTYADALKKYANKRIQITPTCQVTPSNIMYKNGTTIMIDNRSDKAKTLKIGSTFTVSAYGFKIVTLSSSTLPATYFVDCDKQQNVATIILQK